MLDLTRQSGLIPGEVVARTRVCIVGAGAIGSHVAEVLAKMGFYLDDIGKLKSQALAERLSRGTGADVVWESEKLTEMRRFDEDVLIAAVDSMQVRRLIFDCFILSPQAQVLIDGRMGARFGQVHFVDKTDERMSQYQQTLHQDGEGYQEPCTQKSTIFCAYGLSSVIGALLAKYLMGETPQRSADIDFSNMFMDCAA